MATPSTDALAHALRGTILICFLPLGLLLLGLLWTIGQARTDGELDPRLPSSACPWSRGQQLIPVALLLSALLVVFPLVGAAQLASFTLQSDAWANASTVLEGCGRALLWLAQGLLLLLLLSDPSEAQSSRPITTADVPLLLSLSVASATFLRLAAPFFPIVRRALAIGSYALALGLDVAFLGCFGLLRKRQGLACIVAVLGLLAALAADALGLFNAMQMHGVDYSVGRSWSEVARAAAMCGWALSLATWLTMTIGTPAFAQSRPSSRPHASASPAQQRRSVALFNDLGRHEAQYGHLSSLRHLPELPSPTRSDRLDISPSMTWSPDITTPRSVLGYRFDSRVSSHYAPMSVANHSPPRIVQPADGDDDPSFLEIELVAVPSSPTFAKPLEACRSLAPDMSSPQPRPISTNQRSSSTSPTSRDERRLPESPRNFVFPGDAQRAERTTLSAAGSVRSALSDVHLQRRSALVLSTAVDRTERAADQLAVDADLTLEEQRRPMNHSRWSTDSSASQIDARVPHPFWARKTKALTTPGDGYLSAPPTDDQGSSAVRSPLSRLGSLMGKVSHSRCGSRVTTANGPAPVEHPPFDSVAIDDEARPSTTRIKRRPSRLILGEVVSRLSSLAEAIASASPSTAGRQYSHRRGVSDDSGQASMDKSVISLPILIDDLSPLHAVRPSILPPLPEPLEPAQFKQDLRETMVLHGHTV